MVEVTSSDEEGPPDYKMRIAANAPRGKAGTQERRHSRALAASGQKSYSHHRHPPCSIASSRGIPSSQRHQQRQLSRGIPNSQSCQQRPSPRRGQKSVNKQLLPRGQHRQYPTGEKYWATAWQQLEEWTRPGGALASDHIMLGYVPQRVHDWGAPLHDLAPIWWATIDYIHSE